MSLSTKQMKKLHIKALLPFTIFLCIQMIACLLVPSGSHAVGFEGMIQASLAIEGDAAPGNIIIASLTVTSNITTPQIWIKFDIPPGLSVVNGDDHFSGSISAGETRQISINLMVKDDNERTLHGIASVKLPNGAITSSIDSVTIGTRKPHKKPMPSGVNRFGRPVVEYPAQTYIKQR